MSEKVEYIIAWRRFINGDEQALSEIYRQHYLGLINYGRSIIDDPDVVNDCFMQMLVEFWDKRNSLPTVENVRSYLMTSFRRAIFHKLKSDKLRNIKNAESITDENHQWSYEDHLMQIQSDMHLKAKISKAMEKLTDRQKDLIKLKFFDNLNYDEIAEKSGITKRTAYNIIYDAIKILKEELYKDQNSSFQSIFLLFV